MPNNDEHLRAILPLRWVILGAGLLVMAILPTPLTAQLTTTTVRGTIYRADGSAASGTLLVSWSAFTTPQNQAVAAGNVSVPIAPDGFVSMNLTPNAAATPSGSYYTAVYHLSDGTVNTEYWVVPASGTASIASVRAQLEPTNMAVQAASQAYVDSAVASLAGASLPIAGGVMTGPLTLAGDPTAAQQAATKHYADQLAAGDLPLSGGTLTGSLVGAGATFTAVNDVVNPSAFPGQSCSERLAAAEAAAGSGPAVFQISQACAGGVFDAPITIPANDVLQFTQGGTYVLSGIVTLAAGAQIVGPNAGMGISSCGGVGSPAGVVTLQMANGANLAELVHITGGNSAIYGVALDGNAANNTSAGPNILVDNATRVDLDYVVTSNARTNGVSIISDGNTNKSGSGKLFKLMACQNVGDGIYSSGSADGFMTDSETESNGGNGVELFNSPTWRIIHNDFGGNGQSGGCGLKIYGTASGVHANGQIVVANQFGNQFQNDICIAGYDPVGNGITSYSNNLVANSFAGSSFRTPANTWSDLALVDGGGNDAISGNVFTASPSAHLEAYAISQTETASGRAFGNQIGLNSYNGSWGTAQYLDSTAYGTFGQQIPISGRGTDSTLDLFDTTNGDTTPHKFFRVSAGSLQIINSSFTSLLLGLTDAGAAYTKNNTLDDGAGNASFTAGVGIGGGATVASSNQLLKYCGVSTFSGGTTGSPVACSWVTSSSHCEATWMGSAVTGGALGFTPGNGSVTLTAATSNSGTAAVACSVN